VTGPADDAPQAGTPSAAALVALDADSWAALLPHVRAVLNGLDDAEVTAAVARLRAAPVGRLAGGRVRRELCRALTADDRLWTAVVERVADLGSVPERLRWVVDPSVAAPTHPAETPETVRREPPPSPADAQELARLRARLREARDERDVARRRADGAEVRAAALAQQLADVERALEVRTSQVAELEARLAAADEAVTAAVERERRRRANELTSLRDELTAARRDVQQAREAVRRQEQARAAPPSPAGSAPAERDVRDVGDGGSRLVPGRPSRLPDGVEPGTTEAAALLLHAGRRVLVDAYNVTKTHRPALDLEAQRAWLLQVVAALSAQRGILAEVVFDGRKAGGRRLRSAGRAVQVRFTAEGITADDDLVFTVAALDEPVTVVTDDRGLRDRLAEHRVDVIGTRAFLGVAG
jgi:rRNA-processing protein FCF1